MPKICDQCCVGVILQDELGRFGLIFRKNYPRAFALIAGHCDGDSPDAAAKKEAEEEGDIKLTTFKPIFTGQIDNPCKRQNGDKHHWTVYYAYQYEGKFHAGSDAAESFWKTKEELMELARRTEDFMKLYGIDWKDVGRLTRAIFGDAFKQETAAKWEENPGLEPVWYYILKKIAMI